MKTSITKVYEFEAAHHLQFHQGQCRRLHGHSYKLEVTVCGPVKRPQNHRGTQDSDIGMVMDFSGLSTIVKRLIIEPLDHQDLNHVLPDIYTTAENLAIWMWRQLVPAIDVAASDVRLERVTLYETRTGSVTVERE